jgi:hypothetical protein
MTFCLDTQCLIWGVKRQGDRARVEAAQVFLRRAELEKHRIMAPAVAIAEMLVRGSETDRAQWAAVIETSLVVGSFDLRAAVEAAALESSGAKATGHHKMRFDIQIAATAIAWRSDYLLTYDDDLRRACVGHIATRGFEEPGTFEERW